MRLHSLAHVKNNAMQGIVLESKWFVTGWEPNCDMELNG